MAVEKNLKVALVIDDTLDSTDGVQQVMLAIGSWLTLQGHQVHYITSSTSRTDLPHLHSLAKNVRFKINGNRVGLPTLASRKQLQRLVDREKFDVVHVAVPHSPLLSGRLINVLPPEVALVGTFMIAPLSLASRIGGKLLGWWQRSQISRFDRLMAMSPPASEFSTFMYQRPGVVTGGPVDTASFGAARKAALEHKAALQQKTHQGVHRTEPTKVLYLGRLVERKGAGALIRALMRVKELTSHPFTVEIAGTGPLGAEYAALVKKNGLSEIVHFTGFIEEEAKATLLADADVITLPAIGGESFGISVVEALAAGTGSVLVGNNPGYSSVIGPLSECIIDPRDTEEFARTLVKHIESAELRQKMSTRQVERAQVFSPDVVGSRILEIYQEVLQQRIPESN